MKFYVKEKLLSDSKLSSPDMVKSEFAKLADADQESFWVLVLNSNNKVIAKELISLGGVASAMVDLKVLFRRILKSGGSAFIAVHNHPSGNIDPSLDDLRLTNRISGSSQLLDIKFLDHIIVGDDGYYSFQEKGLIK